MEDHNLDEQTFFALLGRFNEPDSIRFQFSFTGFGDTIAFAYVIAAARDQFPDKRIIWDVFDKNKEWAQFFQDAHEVRSHTPFKNAFMPADVRDELRESLINDTPRPHYMAKALRVDPRYIRRPNMIAPPVFHGLNAPPVVICPQSSQRLRMLPLKTWVIIASILMETRIPCMILGTKLDQDEWPCPVYEATSALDMLSLISTSCLVVGGDTGPMHAAGVLNVPALALISVDRPRHVFGAYNSVHCMQPHKRWECVPCLRVRRRGFEDGCYREGCFALADMEPDAIADTIGMILSNTKINQLHHNARSIL